jgi:hypothetical protein
MIDLIDRWWRNYQFSNALKKGDLTLAQQLLLEIQKTGVGLTLLEKLFRDKLRHEEIINQNEREVVILREQIHQATQTIEELLRSKHHLERFLADLHPRLRDKKEEFVLIQQQIAIQVAEVKTIQQKISQSTPLISKDLFLTYDSDLICDLEQKFKLKEIDLNLMQCTGIDEDNFLKLEIDLANYLKSEFESYLYPQQLHKHLQTAYHRDIVALRQGKDPDYNNALTPHIYFMIYFLEGVYSAYLAWFLVYQNGFLPAKCNILDIGAGSGAMLYGLNLFLKKASEFLPIAQTHISYSSLEIRNLLQQHGLEFWRQYVEPEQPSTINAYFQLNTIDLFGYGSQNNAFRELPRKFFDFIVISHCIFANREQRIQSHKIYQKIFSENLKNKGYVLIVVQGRRLYQAYDRRQNENLDREQQLIQIFMDELGLKLEWYKYVTSIGRRVPLNKTEFAKFAKENLPIKKHMSKLLRQYLEQRYDDSYILDDYIILAKKL